MVVDEQPRIEGARTPNCSSSKVSPLLKQQFPFYCLSVKEDLLLSVCETLIMEKGV
jgi:hypothetical protein